MIRVHTEYYIWFEMKDVRHDAVTGAGSHEIGYNIGWYIVLGVRIVVIVAEVGLNITVLRKNAADWRRHAENILIYDALEGR